MRLSKKEYIYTALVAITVMIVIRIIIEIPKIENDLKNNVKQDMVRTISSIIDNFDQKLHTYSSKYPNKTLETILKNDPDLRSELESDLSIVISDDIKYSYVLYRDPKHRFRFMLDGATQDKSEFGRKFDIEDPAWERAYETRKPQLIEQKDLYSLWLTYLKPIVIDNKVQGIIAIDFSLEGHQHITDIVQPLHKYVWIFLALIGLGRSLVSYSIFTLSIITKACLP